MTISSRCFALLAAMLFSSALPLAAAELQSVEVLDRDYLVVHLLDGRAPSTRPTSRP